MTPPAPVDNVATALGLDTMEARDYVLRSYEDLLTRYRTLRGHVRKDGAIKVALPKAVAEREALRLAEKYGRPYTAYPCPICNGMWHTGCDRDDENTTTENNVEPETEAAQTVTISGASDDIVSIEPAVGGLDEIDCFDTPVSLVVTGDDGGCRVIMRYGKHGSVWGAEIVPLDDDYPMPPIRVELGGRGYSAAVIIDGVRHITHENAQVQA